MAQEQSGNNASSRAEKPEISNAAKQHNMRKGRKQKSKIMKISRAAQQRNKTNQQSIKASKHQNRKA